MHGVRVRLVGQHRQANALRLQGGQHFGNARVGTGGHLIVTAIPVLIGLAHRAGQVLPFPHGALGQYFHTIAHQVFIFLGGPGGQAVLEQGAVHGVGNVLQGIG